MLLGGGGGGGRPAVQGLGPTRPQQGAPAPASALAAIGSLSLTAARITYL